MPRCFGSAHCRGGCAGALRSSPNTPAMMTSYDAIHKRPTMRRSCWKRPRCALPIRSWPALPPAPSSSAAASELAHKFRYSNPTGQPASVTYKVKFQLDRSTAPIPPRDTATGG
jgi:hypothetical protein